MLELPHHKCPSCGAYIEAPGNYCRYCGAEMYDSKIREESKESHSWLPSDLSGISGRPFPYVVEAISRIERLTNLSWYVLIACVAVALVTGLWFNNEILAWLLVLGIAILFWGIRWRIGLDGKCPGCGNHMDFDSPPFFCSNCGLRLKANEWAQRIETPVE
jgi:uncharacterized OB-fold protein